MGVDEGVHEEDFEALIFEQTDVGCLRNFVGSVVDAVLVLFFVAL